MSLIPKIRTKTVRKVGSAPFEVFFPKQYLLLNVRVANRIDLSNFYAEANLTEYELGTAGYTNFIYDKSQVNNPEKRQFTETSAISDSFPVGTNISYVITFLEFD